MSVFLAARRIRSLTSSGVHDRMVVASSWVPVIHPEGPSRKDVVRGAQAANRHHQRKSGRVTVGTGHPTLNRNFAFSRLRSMDTFVRLSPSVQKPAARRRPSRRWPRPGPPLRWSSTASRRLPPGGGGAPPPSRPSELDQADAAWLDSLRPWGRRLVARLGLRAHDGEDAVQEAFEQIIADWASFSPTPELPERSDRRRWIAGHLLNAGRRVRDARRRIQSHELPAGGTGHTSGGSGHTPGGSAHTSGGSAHTSGGSAHTSGGSAHTSGAATSPEAHVSARETLRRLQRSTSPDRWRAWIAHEVDGVPVAEIARQEGRPRATIYNLLRLARQDFAAAMAREAVAERAPGPRRGRRRP